MVPVSWSSVYRTHRPGETVPCCKECNEYLGNKPLFTLADRASFLADAYIRKKRKILTFQRWTTEELESVGYGLRLEIEKRLYLKDVYHRKLLNLSLVASGCKPNLIHALKGEQERELKGEANALKGERARSRATKELELQNAAQLVTDGMKSRGSAKVARYEHSWQAAQTMLRLRREGVLP